MIIHIVHCSVFFFLMSDKGGIPFSFIGCGIPKLLRVYYPCGFFRVWYPWCTIVI